MKIKRLKTFRRHLSFFKNHFGLHEPYQVLIDGNFCQVALEMKVHIKDQLPKALSGVTKELVTRCVVEELRKLGNEFSGAAFIASRFENRRCAHTTPIPASECLASLVANGNPNHYIIATQDQNLKASLRQMFGVPIVYLQYNALLLEPPSQASIVKAKEIERQKTQPTPAELKSLSKDAPKQEQRKPRRKRPTAPNPLSTLKKKKPNSTTATKAQKKTRREAPLVKNREVNIE